MMSSDGKKRPAGRESPWELAVGPPPDRWDDWVELDPAAWPETAGAPLPLRDPDDLLQLRVGLRPARLRRQGERRDRQVRGQPGPPRKPRPHLRQGAGDDQPGPRPGAYPDAAEADVGPRGSGQVRGGELGGSPRSTSAAASAKALDEERHDEVMYHVGRPGDDHFVAAHAVGLGHRRSQQPHQRLQRVGANRLRPVVRRGPAVARLLRNASSCCCCRRTWRPATTSTRTPSGSSTQKERGARLAVVDTRLSNTATHADMWISPGPGPRPRCSSASRGSCCVARAHRRDFVRRWVNWEEYLAVRDPGGRAPSSASSSCSRSTTLHARVRRRGVQGPADTVESPRRRDRRGRGKFQFEPPLAQHRERQPRRLAGRARADAPAHAHRQLRHDPAASTRTWDKFVPKPSENPPPIQRWNELIWPQGVPARALRDELPAAAPAARAGARRSTSTSRASTTRSGRTPTAARGSRCSRTRTDRLPRRADADLVARRRSGPTTSCRWGSARAARPDEPGDARRHLDRLPPTGGREFRGSRATEATTHPRRQPGRGLGGGRVLDRADLEDRSGRLPRHPKYYESKRAGRADVPRRVLRGHLRELGPGLPEAAAAEGASTPLEYMRRTARSTSRTRARSATRRRRPPTREGSRARGRRALSASRRRAASSSSTRRPWPSGASGQRRARLQPSQVHWRELDDRRGRAVPAADVPPADADPHALREREVAAGDLAHESAVDHPEDAERLGLENGRSRAGEHAHRLLRRRACG